MSQPTTQPAKRRTEQEGILRFTREMVSALLMALVAIVYVIQAFRIPTGSMERSLLIGDFLLGLKFIYGAPVLPLVTYRKFPGLTDPKPGDVIIFRYPGVDRKDYIKRCVAGPGDTVEINGMELKVNGAAVALPPRGQYVAGGRLPPGIADFPAVRVPARGDVIRVEGLPVREFLFLKHLIGQEHPRASVRIGLQLYVDGEFANDRVVAHDPGGGPVRFSEIIDRPVFSKGAQRVTLNDLDTWLEVDFHLSNIQELVTGVFSGQEIEIRRVLYKQGKIVDSYTVERDNYFMLGDNRDNSTDSRFWGHLNRNFIKAKAFILYFSLDHDVPWWQLPVKIRWNRIGKLIRSYDGLTTPTTPAPVR